MEKLKVTRELGKVIVIALLLAFSLSMYAGTTKPASVLLQEGLYAEEIDGNLDEAIKIYQEVIATSEQMEQAAAQATYRIGLCYVKKGDTDKAAQQFKELISKYPKQEALVQEAKKQLDKITPSTIVIATNTPIDPNINVLDRSGMSLLEEETRDSIEHFEESFAAYFKHETRYELANAIEKKLILQEWEREALGDDFNRRVAAIAALNNVKAKEAVDVLIKIAEEPMSNNRPKWMAVRGLAQVKDMKAVPTLIGLVNHGNGNVRVYSRLALANITSMNFKDDENAWKNWWLKKTDDTQTKTETEDNKSLNPELDRSGMTLLNQETRDAIEHFEQSFAPYFKHETKYELANHDEKKIIVRDWKIEAMSGDFNRRVAAIAALNNVKAPEAVDTLIKIAEEPMDNNRPKWMAVRGLAQIKDMKAVPTLIGLINHGNGNVKVYARLALANITGMNFKDDENAWKNWWLEKGKPEYENALISKMPVVISSKPENYSQNVSPDTTKISVTFDREMMDRSWSWVKNNYPFPEGSGDASYDNTKTICTLNVKMEPGKAYLVMINSDKYDNFKSADGVKAQPFALVFSTLDKNGKPTPIPAEMLNFAKQINSIGVDNTR